MYGPMTNLYESLKNGVKMYTRECGECGYFSLSSDTRIVAHFCGDLFVEEEVFVIMKPNAGNKRVSRKNQRHINGPGK